MHLLLNLFPKRPIAKKVRKGRPRGRNNLSLSIQKIIVTQGSTFGDVIVKSNIFLNNAIGLCTQDGACPLITNAEDASLPKTCPPPPPPPKKKKEKLQI